MELAETIEAVRVRNIPLPSPAMRRVLRRKAGLTQAEVAAVMGGVDRATVARWELGTREPRGALREAYAAVLGALA